MYYLTCPEVPASGVCNDPSWLPVDKVSYLSLSDFLLVFPSIAGFLFVCLGIRWVIRMIFNAR